MTIWYRCFVENSEVNSSFLIFTGSVCWCCSTIYQHEKLNVQTIVLWSCRHVTENGLLYLVNKCRKLESINVWGTRVPLDCFIGLLTISPALQIKPTGHLPNAAPIVVWFFHLSCQKSYLAHSQSIIMYMFLMDEQQKHKSLYSLFPIYYNLCIIC